MIVGAVYTRTCPGFLARHFELGIGLKVRIQNDAEYTWCAQEEYIRMNIQDYISKVIQVGVHQFPRKDNLLAKQHVYY